VIKHLGSYSVGLLFPTMATLLAGVITQLRAQLAGNLRVSAQLAVQLPSIDARIKAAGQLYAQMSLQKPGFKANANVDAIAVLQAQLAVIARLQAALGLGTAGVEAYEYDGSAAAFGAEVASETAGGLPGGHPSDHLQALVLATRYPAVFDALRTIILP
jgi:hypothetical protein